MSKHTPSMTNKEIKQTFQDTWEKFGDNKSTEFLIAITADKCGVSYERVVDALASFHQTTKVKTESRL